MISFKMGSIFTWTFTKEIKPAILTGMINYSLLYCDEQEEDKSDMAKTSLNSAECGEQGVTDSSLPTSKCQYVKYRRKIEELKVC